jgi:hypothetical protein
MAEPQILILKIRLHFQEYEIEGGLPTYTGPSAAQILRAVCLVLAGPMIKAYPPIAQNKSLLSLVGNQVGA